LQDQVGKIFDTRAILRAHELGMKAERLAERGMQRLAHVLLDVVSDQPRRDRAARAEPTRQMRHADADFRRLRERSELLAIDVEQRLAVDPIVRKHRFTAQQVAPVGISGVVAQRIFVIAHDPVGIARVEHARSGRTRRDAGDDARPDLQLRLHEVPEARLPPAAIAAAREYNLIEHYSFPLECGA
jgi:hypothetical protein